MVASIEAFVLIFTTYLGTNSVISSSPSVKTPWGNIAGINIQDGHGNSMEEYLGIPFALPPVGDLRFKKPRIHPGITGTFNASILGPPCIQLVVGLGSKQVIGQEDCLTLNVYVPRQNTSSKRAVMVWIPGGGFILGGDSRYDASPLATVGNVIVVTMQYRLGPFGFLSSMDDAAKGNYGLWDQVLALKWIKRNIAGFGGDPDQITIIGESAGAASVGHLTISPEAKGLFKRAILQSGSAASLWSTKRDPLPVTYTIAKRVGCGHLQNDHPALVACLRAVSATSLASIQWPVIFNGDYATPLVNNVPYAPVVDKEIITADPYTLLTSPHLLKSSPFSTYDIMLGINNNEGADVYGGAVFYDDIFNTSLANDIQTLACYKTKLLPFLIKNYYGDCNSDMTEVATFEYMYPETASKHLRLQAVVNTKSDASFLSPAVLFARTHSSLNGTGKTYLYYFNHNPTMTFSDVESVIPGMHHGYDLYYTFGFSDAVVRGQRMGNISSTEMALSVTFRKILTHFAKFGDPQDAVKGLMLGTWSEFNSTTEEYLDFSDRMTVRNHVAQRRVALWLDLLPRLQDVKSAGSRAWSFISIPQIFG